MRRKLFLFLAVLILILSMFSGCGSKKSSQSQSTANTVNKETAYSVAGGANPSSAAAPDARQSIASSDSKSAAQNSLNVVSLSDGGHKVVYTGDVTIETLEFDSTVNQLIQYVNTKGGYVEMSNISGGKSLYSGQTGKRTASFTFRIPKNDFSKFMSDIKNIGNVISENIKGEDITDKYFDTEARVTTLKIQEQRLLELLKKADKMEDIIKLESELSNIRYQIENLTGTLKKWDNLVDFATVNVTVYEVEKVSPSVVKPKTLWGKVVQGFINSIEALGNILEELLVLIVMILPFAVIIGIIAYISWKIYNWSRRKKSIIKQNEDKK